MISLQFVINLNCVLVAQFNRYSLKNSIDLWDNACFHQYYIFNFFCNGTNKKIGVSVLFHLLPLEAKSLSVHSILSLIFWLHFSEMYIHNLVRSTKDISSCENCFSKCTEILIATKIRKIATFGICENLILYFFFYS